jgi:uncharacterized membrane protein
MTIRLQGVHPSLVHLLIALVHVAVGADILGSATGASEMNVNRV